MNYEREIEKILARNRKVELEKAWEVSTVRRATIAIMTYIVAACMMVATGAERPFFAAAMPAIGYLLSTLALNSIRVLWERKHQVRK